MKRGKTPPFLPPFLSLFFLGEKKKEKLKTSLSSLLSPEEAGGRRKDYPFSPNESDPLEERRRRGDHPARETTATLSSRQMQNYVCLHAKISISKLACQNLHLKKFACQKFAYKKFAYKNLHTHLHTTLAYHISIDLYANVQGPFVRSDRSLG